MLPLPSVSTTEPRVLEDVLKGPQFVQLSRLAQDAQDPGNSAVFQLRRVAELNSGVIFGEVA